MFLQILSIMGLEDMNITDPALQTTALTIILAACCVIAVLFVVMIIDFLARILSRFIPRWNRNS